MRVTVLVENKAMGAARCAHGLKLSTKCRQLESEIRNRFLISQGHHVKGDSHPPSQIPHADRNPGQWARLQSGAAGAARCAHGLSLLAETGDRTLLFDFGPDGDLLEENAAALGVDLDRVDAAFLSHGHRDHAGGMEAFLRRNGHAPVYVHPLAFAPHYSRRPEGVRDISADASLPERYPGRIVLTGEVYAVDGNALLFTVPETWEPVPESNASLYVREGEELLPDPFRHEQALLLREGERLVLFGGCAHRGILNILRRAETLAGRMPDAVFSGFHLTNPGLGGREPEERVSRLGERLERLPCAYYTGHCTGEEPFRVLAGTLGDRVRYMGCGCVFILP